MCFGCRKKGHTLSECPKSNTDTQGTGICFKCGSMNHTSKFCKVKAKDKNGAGKYISKIGLSSIELRWLYHVFVTWRENMAQLDYELPQRFVRYRPWFCFYLDIVSICCRKYEQFFIVFIHYPLSSLWDIKLSCVPTPHVIMRTVIYSLNWMTV